MATDTLNPRSWLYPTPRGLYCAPGDFYVDPAVAVNRAVITHGHGDHARPGHKNALATPETLAIMRARFQDMPDTAQQPLAYGGTVKIGDVLVRLAPAGHILGSAQAVLEHRGQRIVVSGDYKRRPDATCPPFEPVPCDVFITEATFALPVFHHPSDSGEIGKLLRSIATFPERTHLVGVYALGKCQRVIKLLRAAGYDQRIWLHGGLAALCTLYDKHGVDLGETALVSDAILESFKGAIVLCPPAAIADRWSRRFHDPISAMASGWMGVRARARQRGAELPLIISDHADWSELTQTLKDVGAPKVWVTHGREEALVAYARSIGIEAEALHLVGREEEDEVLMQAFARLLDALSFQPARNAKLRLIESYLRETPDPDRGWALAALTGGLDFPAAKPALLRSFGQEKIGEELFHLSYDYVGDLAETLALIWETRPEAGPPPSLGDVVETLQRATRMQTPAILKRWLDALDSTGRWALLKLLTGALRVGVSARLAKQAAANIGQQPVAEVEEVWHGLSAPYRPLFDWLAAGGPKPQSNMGGAFLSPMLANPIERSEIDGLDPAQFRAEWKWDGIRVQVASSGGVKRLYSRAGEDISAAFPDIVEAIDFDGVFDGELLVRRDEAIAPFNDLQQRLNRKTVTPKMLTEHPAHVRLYDVLWLEGEDLRALSFDERRARLERWMGETPRARFDLSPLVRFTDWAHLARLREEMRQDGIEGLMLKRGDSAYLAGRPMGPWFKWKRDPMLADCVMMYAQRGHGKRSSFYSDYTFGAWRNSAQGTRELAPVGKAYFGFTDEELRWLDKWVRDHTTNRFGPVREVEPRLVLEVAFDGVARSTRHKSGVSLRFPRISRIRTDKPAAEADTVDNLLRLVP